MFDVSDRPYWHYIFGVIGAIIACLLIYGGIQKIRPCLWPWVIFNLGLIIVLVIVQFVCIVAWVDTSDTNGIRTYFGLAHDYGDTIIALIGVISIAFITSHAFFIIVVTDYIHELGQEKLRQNKHNNVRSEAHILVPIPVYD